jgi:hypothetical protein
MLEFAISELSYFCASERQIWLMFLCCIFKKVLNLTNRLYHYYTFFDFIPCRLFTFVDKRQFYRMRNVSANPSALFCKPLFRALKYFALTKWQTRKYVVSENRHCKIFVLSLKLFLS